MKTITLIALFAAICLCGCEQSSNYTVSGDFTEYEKNYYLPAKVDSVYILNDSMAVIPAGDKRDIYEVKDGKFQISGSIERPIYSLLRVFMTVESSDGEKHKSVEEIPFILEPGNIILSYNELCGTPLNDASVEMKYKIFDLTLAEEYDKAKKEATNFIKQHAKDPASVVKW